MSGVYELPTEEELLPGLEEEIPVIEPRIPAGEAGMLYTRLKLERLAEEVRRHEHRAGHPAVPKRPADHELYRRVHRAAPDS